MTSSVAKRFPLVAPHWPARKIVTRSGSILRGKFPSPKNGRMVGYEQLLEADTLVLLEMSPRVLSFREQPKRIFYPDGDRTRHYTPDYEVELIDGSRKLIEVKPAKRLRSSDVKHKLDRIAEHLERIDEPFLILTDESIRLQPRLQNLKDLLAQAPLHPPSEDSCRRSMRELARAQVESFSQAKSTVGSEMVSALLYRGLLICRLDEAIKPDTRVSIALESENEWFLIAAKHGF